VDSEAEAGMEVSDEKVDSEAGMEVDSEAEAGMEVSDEKVDSEAGMEVDSESEAGADLSCTHGEQLEIAVGSRRLSC
jgi:hypothetical protein